MILPSKKIDNNNLLVLISLLLFLISPLLSLPLIFWNIFKGSCQLFSLILLAAFFSLLCLVFIDDVSWDISRYYIRFQRYEFLSIDGFLKELNESSDYLFYIILYFFSKLGMSFSTSAVLLSFFNYFVLFYLFYKITQYLKLNNINTNFYFTLYLLSINQVYYLTATRFVLGVSFLLLSCYFYYIKQNKSLQILFMIFSVTTHISLLAFFVAFFILRLIGTKRILLVLIFIVPILGYFIDIESLILMIPIVSFKEKAIVYYEFQEKGHWILQFSYFMLAVTSTLYLIYLLRGKQFIMRYMALFFTSFLLFIISLPIDFWTYDRFGLILKPVLVVTLMCTNKGFLNRWIYKMFSFCLLVCFCSYYIYTISIFRDNLVSIFDYNKIFLPLISLIF